MLISNEDGAVALPMRLAAAAILFSIIVVISAAALADISRNANVDRFSADLSAVEARASVIYQQGGARNISDPVDRTETKETIHLTVPDGIEIVVFGSMPHQDNGIPCSAYENNVIYYTTYEGITTTITSSACFANLADSDNPVILTPGSYELNIELVKDSNTTFITLY
jgi:hypothetical protein